MADCPERQVLVDNICLLACEFSRLCDSQCLRLGFDVLTTNKCPKFHIDHVASRLLCNYRGVGTEYSFLNDQNRPAEVFLHLIVQRLCSGAQSGPLFVPTSLYIGRQKLITRVKQDFYWHLIR
jgi:hypothetical protein